MLDFLFGRGKEEPKTDFSAFFHDASSRDKKKLLKEVVREANKDQRDIVARYRKIEIEKIKTAAW